MVLWEMHNNEGDDISSSELAQNLIFKIVFKYRLRHVTVVTWATSASQSHGIASEAQFHAQAWYNELLAV